MIGSAIWPIFEVSCLQVTDKFLIFLLITTPIFKVSIENDKYYCSPYSKYLKSYLYPLLLPKMLAKVFDTSWIAIYLDQSKLVLEFFVKFGSVLVVNNWVTQSWRVHIHEIIDRLSKLKWGPGDINTLPSKVSPSHIDPGKSAKFKQVERITA